MYLFIYSFYLFIYLFIYCGFSWNLISNSNVHLLFVCVLLFPKGLCQFWLNTIL